jgi:hypothetical protein
MLWADPTDPDVISWITGAGAGVPGAAAETEAALGIASDLLTRLTGYLVHPSGVAEEQYAAYPWAMRLVPTWRPIRRVISVEVIDKADCTLASIGDAYCLVAGDIWLTARWRQCPSTLYEDMCGCRRDGERLRLTYVYGTTVTTAARAAALDYARQIWLSTHPDQGDCELPERVTSINREGLSYTVIDPQTYLERGRTGVTSVDTFLAAWNPSRALRPAAVYTPEAPPGVGLAAV